MPKQNQEKIKNIQVQVGFLNKRSLLYRFLPPGSYINARNITPTDLASVIANFMTPSSMYSRLFQWMSSYSYHDPSETDNVCAVCEALHNKEMFDSHSVYKNLRSWWHPNYKERCKT